jgi:hypothetical protein
MERFETLQNYSFIPVLTGLKKPYRHSLALHPF